MTSISSIHWYHFQANVHGEEASLSFIILLNFAKPARGKFIDPNYFQNKMIPSWVSTIVQLQVLLLDTRVLAVNVIFFHAAFLYIYSPSVVHDVFFHLYIFKFTTFLEQRVLFFYVPTHM